MDEIDELIAQVRSHGQDIWLAGAQPEEAIAELEDALGVALPPSYRDFLARFGAARVSGAVVCGIAGGQPLSQAAESLHGETVRLRGTLGLPAHLLVIQSDKRAPYCLDSGRPGPGGEYPVVCYQVRERRVEHLADSFGEWLVEWLLRPTAEGEV